MHIVIFTSPSIQKGAFVFEAVESADKIIAADCGAAAALSIGIVPEVIIGDFDSLEQGIINSLKSQHVRLIKSPAAKDETDTQLAISYAIKQGASKITLAGGIDGNRFDHALANAFLAYSPNVPITLVNGAGKTWIVTGPQELTIHGRKNNLISLTSISIETSGMTTKGLLYPLHNESLYFGTPRGMSNVMLGDEASVKINSGTLLITHTNHEEI